MTSSKTPIIAAADGSALGNPGPAGWAWYIDESNWASGGWDHGTNNMGELTAVLDLLQATAHVADRPLKILCDSQYAINCVSKWMPGWKKKGWKKADGKPVLNREILEELDAAIEGRTFEFEWVKGHAGHPLNEKADDLARAAASAFQAGESHEPGPGFSQDGVGTTRAAVLEEPVGDALEQESLLLKPEIYTHQTVLGSLLHPDFFWITPAGRRVDRASVIEHRERAFASHGEPEDISLEQLNEYTALVVSTVTTNRGQVIRSSTWMRDNPRNGSWRLRFRQETAH